MSSNRVLSTNEYLCNPNGMGKKTKNNLKNNLFNLDTRLRLYVLDVACFVDGLSVYFADGFCSKKRICIDLSVC